MFLQWLEMFFYLILIGVLIRVIILLFTVILRNFRQKRFYLSFSNAPKNKKEYEERKSKKNELVTGDFYFWDKLEIPSFETNKKYLENWTCPYCNEKLIERKGKTFKCPHCKEKIFRKKELATKQEGLFTEKQKIEIDLLWEEYYRRTRLLEHYQYIDKIIIPEPTLLTIGNLARYKYTDDKKKNMETLIFHLHLGLPSYYQKQNLNKLRECRYYEGLFQEVCGTIQQATNAYMVVLYIDLMGDYCELYNDRNFSKKELKADGIEEWGNGFIAPRIIKKAFQENLSMEKFKEIFLSNAYSLIKVLQFKPPITPQAAWEKILEYKKRGYNSLF